jgi:hypothetical protein
MLQHLKSTFDETTKTSRIFYHFCGASLAAKSERNLVKRILLHSRNGSTYSSEQKEVSTGTLSKKYSFSFNN